MNERIKALQKSMQHLDANLIAVSAGPDLLYLTGLDFHVSERPAILLIPLKGESLFIFPEFESGKVSALDLPLQAFPYQEERATWVNACHQAMAALPGKTSKIGVNSTQMRFLEMNLLQQVDPSITFQSADSAIQDLRTCKDSEEVANIRQAIQIAQEAFLKTIKNIRPGRTEKEIASELVMNLFQLGSDPELPFSPIVASGPNSANPHAIPSERALQEGDLVIIDWGASYHHYISDITRTLAIGQPSARDQQIAAIVKAANQAGRDTAKAGVLCSAVDEATRKVIRNENFGDFFTHRTGHGFGMEAHEAPYIASDFTQPLQAGNTFTIEPGIYLPGDAGVRIEDDVLATQDGCLTLTSLPRELFIIE